jgi:hypothetical protein
LNLTVNNSGGNRTRIYTYVNNSLTELTDPSRHFVNYNYASELAKTDWIFTKGHYDFIGNSVANLGDVNGDGYDDFGVAGLKADPPGTENGQVFIFYGGPSFDNIPDVTLFGTTNLGQFGSSISGAGDVNGDGYDDVIVTDYPHSGALSNVYIYYGGNPMDNVVDVTLQSFAKTGYESACSKAGDVNRDGFDDVIVGEAFNSSGGANRGRALIYFGGSPMNNIPDIILSGEAAGDLFGCSVSDAGDVNRDGYSDVIVGAEGNSSQRGKAYIFYGGASMNNVADVIMSGSTAGDRFGYSVSEAGDYNGDGFSDVIVGSPFNDVVSENAGKAEIFYGGSPMNSIADVTFWGEGINDRCGMKVACAGNVNNDIYSDVIVSSPLSKIDGRPNSGRVRIFYGGSVNPPLVLTGNPYSNFGVAACSAGDVNNDGSDDILVGGLGNMEGNGGAYLYYSNAYPGHIQMTLNTLIQGFYAHVTNAMIPDTVRVYLMSATVPFQVKDSAIGVLNSNGQVSLNFVNANAGMYYVVVKHRNSIETWSANAVGFVRGGHTTVTLFNAQNAVFGSNQIQVDNSPVRFAMLSGDVNKDGLIDLSDISIIHNDASNFISGYVRSDVTGDNNVDLTDMMMTYNNANNFVAVVKP